MVPSHSYYGSDDEPTDRKSMLFCWECDYASSIENDVILQTNRDYIQYACPRCGTVLTERPRTETVPVFRRRPAEHMVTAWQHALQASMELWRMPFGIDPAVATMTTDYRGHG